MLLFRVRWVSASTLQMLLFSSWSRILKEMWSWNRKKIETTFFFPISSRTLSSCFVLNRLPVSFCLNWGNFVDVGQYRSQRSSNSKLARSKRPNVDHTKMHMSRAIQRYFRRSMFLGLTSAHPLSLTPSWSQHSIPTYMYRILPSLDLRIPIPSHHENIHNHQKALFNKQSPPPRRNQSIRSFPSISSFLLHAIIRRYGCRIPMLRMGDLPSQKKVRVSLCFFLVTEKKSCVWCVCRPLVKSSRKNDCFFVALSQYKCDCLPFFSSLLNHLLSMSLKQST